MKKANCYIPEQLESLRKMQSRSFLEVVLYQSLIDEIEECVITNKQPFLFKVEKDLKDYPELISFVYLEGTLPTDENTEYYFHLESVDIGLDRKYPKQTLEDYMHKNIQLTLVYK